MRAAGHGVWVRRPPIRPARLDAPRLDAPRLDAPRLDAPRLDAPRLDAPRVDAPFLALTTFYAAGLAAGTAIFAAAFAVGAFASIGILFYRGLAVVAVAALVHALLMTVLRALLGTRRVNPANLVSVVCLTAMLNLTFFTLVPVNLDRSISVFLLAWMDRTGRPMRRADLQAVFQKIYVDRYDAIGRRIDEQIASGNIRATPSGYALTPQGRRFNALARSVGAVFPVDPRFVHPHCANADRAQSVPGCVGPD